MHEICFPAINLKLSVSSIAFKIGNINIFWYAIMIVSSIIIALLFLSKDSKKYYIDYEKILELVLWIIPISLIGARVYYVLFKLDYYSKHVSEILNFRNGGLAIYGGIIGGVITVILFCKKNKIKILDMLDMIVPYLALGQSIGRWGNFFNVEAYGYETNSIFRMGIIENGKYIEVHPTFLYESICTFIIFIILMRLRKNRKYSGELTYVYIFLYSLARTFIENLRYDSLKIGNLKVSMLFSIILFVSSLWILIIKRIKNVKTIKNEK